MERFWGRMRSAVLAILGFSALVLLGLVCAWRSFELPPETTEPALAAASLEEQAEPLPRPADREELPAGEAVSTVRQNGVYTLLLAGSDNGNGNTDTLILGRVDTVRHEMDFVSLPRDTLVNLPWRVRKLNAVYWGARMEGENGIEALKRQVGRLTGFEPDCCAVIDMELVARAVDCVGGIPFDVPMAMDYEDPSQDLSIHLQPGPQLLDGEAAMGLCRYRSGYVTGDLGRIEMQQRFLQACAKQLLSLGTVPRAAKLISLLTEHLDTDLSAGNMAFFLRQLLLCRGEDIHFWTAPCTPEIISGYSYAVLDLEPWLDMLNLRLKPFETDIGPEQLDLVYRSGEGYAGTAGLRGADYYLTTPAPVSAPAGGSDDAGQNVRTAGAGGTEGDGPVILVIEP